MQTSLNNKEKLCLDIIQKIRAALDFEMQHQYINAIGKTGDFRSFIRREAQEALKIFRDSLQWQNIYALMERYAFLDLATRMSLCKKIIHNINELEDYYQTEINSHANPPKEEVLKPIDPNLDISELEIQYVKGVGPALAAKLNKLGIKNCEDLLNYLPRQHISYSDVTPIKDLQEEQDVTIMGQLTKITAFKSPNKNLVILSIFIKDNSAQLKINKFFQGNSAHFYLKQYKGMYPIGAYCICVGTVKRDKFSKQKTIHNAIIEIISEDFSETDRSERIHTAKIVPIYPLTEGLSLMVLRKLIHKTLNAYKNNLKEFIPANVLEANHLIGYAEAIEEIHFPTSLETKNKAATRLLFSEMFLMQVRFMQVRYKHKHKNQGIQFNCFENGLVDKFIGALPFELTYAQQRVFYQEILPDMVSNTPMHRLLQGDVGSGKTVVAFLALLVAVADGYQGAIMVPTEILAEQHYKKFNEWVNRMHEELRINVALLIGKQRVRERRAVLEGLKSGGINIVVGTHALIQEKVEFKRLGLIVIDEQHRFGVKQREELARKVLTNSEKDTQLHIGEAVNEEIIDREFGTTIEKLFMTATPIPRSLALAMHGDLDMSEIDEMPVGRIPIITEIVSKKSDAYKLIKDEIDKGNQAYIVFPLIEESETLAAKAATVEHDRLQKTIFQDYKMGLLHGRLKEDEKNNIMDSFRRGEIQILVATTVIEVGVDVANATVMLIESAERFGLAQLHQLRGRVGRSDKQSYCLLSSSSSSETSRQRLSILTKTNDGFIIAQEDLKIRGAGDIIGLKQSGIPESALQGLVDQEDLLIHSRNAARQLIDINPELDDLDALKKKLTNSAANAHLNAG
jgi:ATP-dependent DNA helicase RecG